MNIKKISPRMPTLTDLALRHLNEIHSDIQFSSCKIYELMFAFYCRILSNCHNQNYILFKCSHFEPVTKTGALLERIIAVLSLNKLVLTHETKYSITYKRYELRLVPETIESGPLCITDLFQNKSVA